MITQAQLNELIDDLRGTCQSLEEGCRKLGFGEDDLTQEQREHLDGEIFQCSLCSWWDDAGEQDEDQRCESCKE